MKARPLGFIVVEACEEWELPLMLIEPPGTSPGAGVLTHRERGAPATVFPSRKAARAAIVRTRHWASARVEPDMWPQQHLCVITPVVAAHLAARESA